MDAMTFGEKVDKLCEAKGWVPAELARRCGVSRNTAGRWIADERQPYTDKLLRLAEVLGVSVDYLTDDAQDEPPAPELTSDEREILRSIRASGLGYQEVMRRLMAGAATAPVGPASAPGRPVVTDIDPRTNRPYPSIKPESRDRDQG